MPYTTNPALVESVECYAGIVIVLELVLLVMAGMAFRVLLRMNLTLKKQLLEGVAHLKQAKQTTEELSLQLHQQQNLLGTQWKVFIQAIPKPLRWISTLLRWFL
jgi:hypothetical protein